MELKFQTEKKENSQIQLSVTIDKNEIASQYKELLNETQKNIVMNGFRKGKVPLSIIETKYKKALLAEVAHKLVDKSYQEIFEKLEDKPLATSTPTLDDIEEIKLDSDFTYKITYETYPTITFGEYKNIEIEKDEITASEKDISEEINRYLSEFSSIETKDSQIEDGDIALIEYKVFEGDTEIESKDNEYVHIGKDYDKYKIGKELIGLKSSDTKDFKKKFTDKDGDAFAGKTYKFKATVKEVKVEKKPELTDELAKQIDKTVETAEAFKNKVKENLEHYAADTTKQKAIDKIMDKIIKTFKGVVPQSMIDAQIDSYYKELLQKVGGDEKRANNMLSLEGLNKETYREKMKEKATNAIQRSLILNEIIKKESIKATEEDIKAHINKFAKFYNLNTNDLFDNYKKNNQLAMFEGEVEIEKAIDIIYNSLKAKKINKLSLKELDD
ncbi:MAG: trigger factor [Spirochaetes bacterium GWF1_31_7]|nr:MAG: trigger factor [Spirochaetes bacterium GWE1_32_154]OHD46559.1 MAG: trigger factor [Spirochaetes bacterium GWF1_31_7]OHD49368.1 MAG: trigger factor [Spirochaetes bacterium GWE2_31_10]OHD83355.1 MAG: trigger factor [Spirochaetes bacterium RIFOXYB1_FULL_32_8]HBD93109.1 trigger factor [Spirochaetia bacterium]